ncbi:sensor histidine kinase [Nocardioides sp.]|uniref:sensor histidine kinase n=1 Tax=Nocardioides sp. TaxID=35761 RepID=UPI002ED553C9
MDGTLSTLLAALLGAGVAGVAVYAWSLSDRLRRQAPPVPDPVLPPGIGTVLSVLRSSAVVVGEDGVVVKASAPAYSLGLVQGHRLAPVELAEMVEQVRRDGDIRETELLLSRPDGLSARNVEARVAPLSSRLILVLVDDRTRERQVEAVRRDFVANVSHELKTPVGAIRLLAEAVRDAAHDPEAVQRFGGRMMTESDRLTRLVQQIIELSRLQAADPLGQPLPVQIDEVVKNAIDTCAIDADAARITVVSRGASGLEVLGNAEQITAAVANLVANAIAYSEAGSTVLVSTKGQPESVEVSVVDQGIGIPEPEVRRIFERFYRVDPARHRSTGGTGLGLSIVKHVAATHGGDINVWSVEGQGSTFTLTLPRRKQEHRP